MKAITLWQPWATLIALGVKTIETRSWSTDYRGPIAIHAAKRPADPGRYGEWWASTSRLVKLGRQAAIELPRGAVVATATLAAVVPTEDCHPDPYGDYTPGRYAWVLFDITPVDPPVPARGRQGLWTWEPDTDPKEQT